MALCVMDAVMPGPLEASGQPNPLGIDSARAALERSYGLDLLCFVLLTLLCAGSVVVHFRRAGGAERQQLKWFAAGAGQLAVLIALALGLPGLWNRWVSLTVSDVVFGISFALIPVTIGIAILRYRPYDIDRLIHRTLVYALLTALLAAVYAGLVLSLGRYSAASVASHRAGPWRRHPDRRGTLPAGPPTHPADRGPTLQPASLRHHQDDRGVQRPPAPPRRPGRALGRAAGGGRPDHGTDQGLTLAPTLHQMTPEARSSQLATGLARPWPLPWTLCADQRCDDVERG